MVVLLLFRISISSGIGSSTTSGLRRLNGVVNGILDYAVVSLPSVPELRYFVPRGILPLGSTKRAQADKQVARSETNKHTYLERKV